MTAGALDGHQGPRSVPGDRRAAGGAPPGRARGRRDQGRAARAAIRSAAYEGYRGAGTAAGARSIARSDQRPRVGTGSGAWPPGPTWWSRASGPAGGPSPGPRPTRTCGAIDERLIVVSCPAYPAGHRLAETPAYDALVQASSGQMWAQPGWRPGPIFLHMPVPSMGAAFPGQRRGPGRRVARQRTGRGQHVQTSLFQGALLYTTQLYQDVENPGPGYHELMAKTYPPGIHQTMLFECAGGAVDPHLGHVGPPAAQDPRRGHRSGRRPRRPHPHGSVGARAGRPRRPAPAADAVVGRRRTGGATAPGQPRGRGGGPAQDVLRHVQTVANGTVTTVDDPDVGATRQMGVPIHLLGTPGAVQGPQPRPGAHTDRRLRLRRPRGRGRRRGSRRGRRRRRARGRRRWRRRRPSLWAMCG